MQTKLLSIEEEEHHEHALTQAFFTRTDCLAFEYDFQITNRGRTDALSLKRILGQNQPSHTWGMSGLLENRKFKTMWCPIGAQHDWQTCAGHSELFWLSIQIVGYLPTDVNVVHSLGFNQTSVQISRVSQKKQKISQAGWVKHFEPNSQKPFNVCIWIGGWTP